MPIAEEKRSVLIASTTYNLTLRGHDVVDIDPPGKWRPIFSRPQLRKPEAAVRTVERFIPDDTGTIF
jgi:hypothetical protein